MIGFRLEKYFLLTEKYVSIRYKIQGVYKYAVLAPTEQPRTTIPVYIFLFPPRTKDIRAHLSAPSVGHVL